jgi:hypothetical protein
VLGIVGKPLCDGPVNDGHERRHEWGAPCLVGRRWQFFFHKDHVNNREIEMRGWTEAEHGS